MGTPITEIKAVWTGFLGAPGYSQFYFLTGDQPSVGAQADADAVRTMFAGISGAFPAAVTIDVQQDFRVLDDETGALIALDQMASDPLPVTGDGAGTFAGPTGAVVNWVTAGINRGRRVRGKTFLVPLVTSAYQDDGTLTSGTRSSLLAYAQGLLTATAGDFAIWSRPRAGAGGKAVAVSGVNVPDLAAVLRSRRD